MFTIVPTGIPKTSEKDYARIGDVNNHNSLKKKVIQAGDFLHLGWKLLWD
jgi:hypothetical protein